MGRTGVLVRSPRAGLAHKPFLAVLPLGVTVSSRLSLKTIGALRMGAREDGVPATDLGVLNWAGRVAKVQGPGVGFTEGLTKLDLTLRSSSIWWDITGVVVLVMSALGLLIDALRKDLMNAPLKVGVSDCLGGFNASA